MQVLHTGSASAGERHAFTEARTGGTGALPAARAPLSAETSMGSPSGVPVPCTTSTATLPGARLPESSAFATSACSTSPKLHTIQVLQYLAF